MRSFKKLWLRVTAKNLNDSLDKTSAMRRPFKLGDFVIHTPSGRRGAITSIETVGGHEVITFAGVRRAARQEIRLANTERYRSNQ